MRSYLLAVLIGLLVGTSLMVFARGHGFRGAGGPRGGAETSGGAFVDGDPPIDSGDPLIIVQEADGDLALSWSAATDNVAVTGYRVKTGLADSQIPPTGGCDSADDTIYEGTDLTTTYTAAALFEDQAFRVCAYDAAGNLSDGITGFERPHEDVLSIRLNEGSTNEHGTIADNAALECSAEDQITAWCWHKTLDISATDRMLMTKAVTPATDSWSLVTIANVGGDTYAMRFAVSAIGDYCMFGAGTDDDAGSGWYMAGVTCNMTLTGGGTATETNDIKCDAVMTPEGTEPTVYLPCTGGAPTVMPDVLVDDASNWSLGAFATTPLFPWIGYLDECGYACVGKVDISVFACLAEDGHPNDPRNCFPPGTPIHYLPVGDGDTHPALEDRASGVTAVDQALLNSEAGDFTSAEVP